MPKERNTAACNYGFTVDELKERKGLKQFFGFKDSINLIRLSEEHTVAFKEEMQEPRHSGRDLPNAEIHFVPSGHFAPRKPSYRDCKLHKGFHEARNEVRILFS